MFKSKKTQNGVPIPPVKGKIFEGYLFFFKKGKLVDVASAYFGNNDFDINPGQTVTREMSRRKDYDSVEFYFTGYGKPIAKEGNG